MDGFISKYGNSGSKEKLMEIQFRCLTCYEKLLTQEDYLAHRARGHVTVEYVNYDEKPKKEDE